MSTPADPPGHDRSRELPELDRPPAGCRPPARPDPEAVGRLAVGGGLLVIALLTAGFFVGGPGPSLATLLSSIVAAVVGVRLLPVRYHGHAFLAGHVVVVAAVLLV